MGTLTTLFPVNKEQGLRSQETGFESLLSYCVTSANFLYLHRSPFLHLSKQRFSKQVQRTSSYAILDNEIKPSAWAEIGVISLKPCSLSYCSCPILIRPHSNFPWFWALQFLPCLRWLLVHPLVSPSSWFSQGEGPALWSWCAGSSPAECSRTKVAWAEVQVCKSESFHICPEFSFVSLPFVHLTIYWRLWELSLWLGWTLSKKLGFYPGID